MSLSWWKRIDLKGSLSSKQDTHLAYAGKIPELMKKGKNSYKSFVKESKFKTNHQKGLASRLHTTEGSRKWQTTISWWREKRTELKNPKAIQDAIYQPGWRKNICQKAGVPRIPNERHTGDKPTTRQQINKKDRRKRKDEDERNSSEGLTSQHAYLNLSRQ